MPEVPQYPISGFEQVYIHSQTGQKGDPNLAFGRGKDGYVYILQIEVPKDSEGQPEKGKLLLRRPPISWRTARTPVTSWKMTEKEWSDMVNRVGLK